MRIVSAAALVVLCLGLTACATGNAGVTGSPPVQEMSDARQAVAAAERAGVRSTSGSTLGRARHWLERAREHLRDGDYPAAREAARRARAYARAARTDTGSH